MEFITPKPLKKGDLLIVIAPSGVVKEYEKIEKAIKIWGDRGYQVELDNNWNTRYGYLAGTDQQRRQALQDAWENPQCKGILSARGGYGSARLLENWTWGNQCKWLIGFSDITGLLWSLATKGIKSIHGPVLTTLAQEPEWSIQRLFDAVEGKKLAPLSGKGWGGGKVTGHLLPANLTVATHLLKTPLQPSLKSSILALEDVGESPYRIDRMLTQWRLNGCLNEVAGIALGRFSQCDASPGCWTVEEVLGDRLADLGIPIVSELPFGHDGENAALPVGKKVELDADHGFLFFESNS
jgi:muramoyltetrapeptide carboxypeptidase